MYTERRLGYRMLQCAVWTAAGRAANGDFGFLVRMVSTDRSTKTASVATRRTVLQTT